MRGFLSSQSQSYQAGSIRQTGPQGNFTGYEVPVATLHLHVNVMQHAKSRIAPTGSTNGIYRERTSRVYPSMLHFCSIQNASVPFPSMIDDIVILETRGR